MRSSIAIRLGLVSLLFMVPIGALLGLLVASHAGDIDFAKTELRGLAALSALAPVEDGLAQALLSGRRDGLPSLADRVRDAAAALPEVAHEADIAATALRDAPHASGLDAARGALRDLLGALGDRSNITLDPVADTYYAGEAAQAQIPDAMDRLAAAAALPRRTEAERTALALALGGLQATTEGLAGSLDAAVAANATGEMRRTMSAPGAAALAALRRQSGMLLAGTAGAADVADALGKLAAFAAPTRVAFGDATAARIAAVHGREAREIGFSLALFLFGAGIGLLVLLRGVVRPLRRLTAAMQRLADGDLGAVVPGAERRDEVGGLARSMAVFKANAIAARDADRAGRAEREEKLRRQEELVAAARTFGATTRRQLAELDEAAGRLNVTAVALSTRSEQVSREADAVAANAEDALRNAQRVAAGTEQFAVSGREIERRTALAAVQTRAVTAQSSDARAELNGLSEAAGSISEVAGLIRAIAAQTNLLALNATIEAARAGESGRGFAVVAEEVKSLAAQTVRAVEAVHQRIEAIRSGAEAVRAVIDRTVVMAEEVSAGAASIAGAVAEQFMAAGDIIRATQQCTAGAGAVAGSLGEVRAGVDVSRQASASMTEAAALVAGRTRELSGEVARFVAAVGS